MVGTSAIRSPAARHRMTARRNADTVRTTRMGMGTGFVGLGSQRANLPKRRRGGHVCRATRGAPRRGHCAASRIWPPYGREFRPLNACCHGQRSSRPLTDGPQPRTGGNRHARGDRRVPCQGEGPRFDRRTRAARTAHLRARRDHEPPTLVGYGLPAAGGHVPRGGGHRRPRRAAGLLPRPRRVPGLALGLAGRSAGHADGADRLPRRPYPDRQDHRPRQARDADHQGAGPGFRRRRHGGKARRSLSRRRRARTSGGARFHVPGRRRSHHRTSFSRDRAPDARRLLPLRSGRGARTRRTVARRRRLRRGRHACARRSLGATPGRRNQAARADETVMATIIFGLVVLALVLWALNAFTKVNPQTAAVMLKTGGGLGALAAAGLLGVRGRLDIAIPLGLTGLGLLGWLPWSMPGFSARTQKSAGQVSRVRSAFVEMELDHDTGAMRGRILAGPHEGAVLDALDVATLTGFLPEIDEESRALLVAYLDRREPRWREHAQGDAATGADRRAWSGGKMTEEEAYQILGVEPGASAEDIGRAHRALMKKLHPDQGGSTYLAARVNEAKEVLLRRHR